MAKKKPDFIPEVDIIKSGINRNKSYTADENGLVKISRKPKIDDLMAKHAVNELLEKKKELAEIEERLEKQNIKKSDIKDIKDDIKKDKKKKKKKEKKKEKNKDTYMLSMLDAMQDDALAEYIRNGGEKGEKKKKKKDKKKKKERAKIEGLVIKDKKKDKDKKKPLQKDKNKSEVAERFKEVERITRENIKEIDSTMAVVDERIKDIIKTSERVRGKDRALADYIAAKTSLISSRQKAATDILSNRAKVYDIEMKKAKDAGSAASDADLISKLFPGIAMNSAMSKNIEDQIGKSGKNKDSKKKKKGKKRDDFYSDNEEAFYKREKDLLDSGDIKYSKYDQNIEYEGSYNIAIKKGWEDGSWKFIAVDDDGKFLDIPKSMLPSKKSASIKWDDEKDVALDTNTNTMYQVFNVPRI